MASSSSYSTAGTVGSGPTNSSAPSAHSSTVSVGPSSTPLLAHFQQVSNCSSNVSPHFSQVFDTPIILSDTAQETTSLTNPVATQSRKPVTFVRWAFLPGGLVDRQSGLGESFLVFAGQRQSHPDCCDAFVRMRRDCAKLLRLFRRYTFQISSDNSSSGVHISGQEYPAASHMALTTGFCTALSICLQFHVNKKSIS